MKTWLKMCRSMMSVTCHFLLSSHVIGFLTREAAVLTCWRFCLSRDFSINLQGKKCIFLLGKQQYTIHSCICHFFPLIEFSFPAFCFSPNKLNYSLWLYNTFLDCSNEWDLLVTLCVWSVAWLVYCSWWSCWPGCVSNWSFVVYCEALYLHKSVSNMARCPSLPLAAPHCHAQPGRSQVLVLCFGSGLLPDWSEVGKLRSVGISFL